MDYQTRIKTEPPEIIEYMQQLIQNYFLSPPVWGNNIFFNKDKIFERDEEAKTNYFITYVAVFIKKYVETEMNFIDKLYSEKQKEQPNLTKAKLIKQNYTKDTIRKQITECPFFHFVVTDDPFFFNENEAESKEEKQDFIQ